MTFVGLKMNMARSVSEIAIPGDWAPERGAICDMKFGVNPNGSDLRKLLMTR